jgi:hypothetical protein
MVEFRLNDLVFTIVLGTKKVMHLDSLLFKVMGKEGKHSGI